MKYWSVGFLFLSLGCRPADPPSETEKLVGYANPELIVETEWLAEHGADDVVIVDARSDDDYTAGHIPGAVNIPRSTTFDPDAELRVVGPPEQIAELFGRQGIDENVHVVVYDEGVSTAAARVFWTLEYYSHPWVSVLNGGFAKWKAESRAISTEASERAPVTFNVRVREDALTTKAELLSDIDVERVAMLDVRSPEEYVGEKLYSERGGHLPDAVNIEWTRNYTEGDAPVFQSAVELEAMYAREGVTKDKRVHAY